MYQVEFTEAAEADLDDALAYVRTVLKAPEAADRLLDRLEQSAALLAESPQAHPLVRDEHLATQGVRSVVLGNYLAFYVIKEQHQKVTIVRFLHGRRDWSTLL